MAQQLTPRWVEYVIVRRAERDMRGPVVREAEPVIPTAASTRSGMPRIWTALTGDRLALLIRDMYHAEILEAGGNPKVEVLVREAFPENALDTRS